MQRTCLRCGKTFPTKTSLSSHRYFSNCIDKAGLKCSQCGQLFEVKALFAMHTLHHQMSSVLPDLKSIIHAVRATDGTVHGVFCIICKALVRIVTRSSDVVSLHLKDSHGIRLNIFPCMFCNTASCNFEDLAMHHSTSHPDEATLKQCNICGLVRTNLTPHYVSYHKLSKCRKCKIYLPGNKLHSHNLAEHALKCMYCDMMFFTLSARRTHLKIKHPSSWKHMKTKHLIRCENCSAVFTCEEKLQEHNIECSKYAEEYQLVCPFHSSPKKCNQRFNSYQMLQRHIFSRHKKGRPSKEKYKCKSCGLRLRTGRSLAMHLKYRVCQAECQVMSKSKASADGSEGPQKNPTLKKLKEENQDTASESDGEICVD